MIQRSGFIHHLGPLNCAATLPEAISRANAIAA
jgi:hypothetical protein